METPIKVGGPYKVMVRISTRDEWEEMGHSSSFGDIMNYARSIKTQHGSWDVKIVSPEDEGGETILK